MKCITIGTRGSELALIQADVARRALLSVLPTLDIRIEIIKTEGDINTAPIPLDVVGKGWFTKEIESALLEGTIDLAVHSLKDMADVEIPELAIGAYIMREDPRDVLVTKHGEALEELKHGAIIGTDSVRRRVQMEALRPDVHVESIRGNVTTRLEKLASQHYDAVILAAAGLKRLNLEARITRYFSITEMTPSPGQGTLALQARKDDVDLQKLLSAVNDPDVAHIAHVERSFSSAVGGGCKAPVGAYAYREGDTCTLIGMLAKDGGLPIRETLSRQWNESAGMGGELAHLLLQR